VELHASETCAECGSRLARETGGNELNAVWHCPNQDCPARIRERIAHWCSPEAMDIAGVDAELVGTLVSKGLTYDVGEIYRLKLKEIAALEGMSPEAAQRLFDAITASMKRDAWRVLFGLGIPAVGAVEARALGKGFPSVDAVFAAGAPRLMREGVVNDVVAENLVRWYADSVNRRMVKRLEKAGLNFRSELYRPGGG
jgi:DNA ligase (NAD+)